MNMISVVLAADDAYAQHVAVASASILLNATHPEAIHIYVLSDGISEGNCAKITDTIQALQGRVSFVQKNADDIHGFTSGHISRAAYLRLMIPEWLPEDVRKAIYLDTDLVVLDDIAKLWNISLEGQPLGAVYDFGIMGSNRMMRQKNQTLGLPLDASYFNSGVLVFDMEQWRRHSYSKQVVQCISAHSFRHHDQDGLNKVFMNHWQELPLRWNVIPPVFSLPLKVLMRSKLRTQAVQALKHPAVFHWAGRYKPWEFTLQRYFNPLYYQYLRHTAFQDVPMPQPGRDMQGKSIARQEFRMKLASWWMRILS